MNSYIDSHAHLSMLGPRGIDADARLENLFASGFGAILDVGTKSGDLAERIRAFGRFPAVRFSAGIWPSAEAISDREREIAALEASMAAAEPNRLVAVGECGFDRHWNKAEDGADIKGERELFDAQARLALARDLPIIIHSREAVEETESAIAAVPGLRGVVHCFSYGKEEARRFLDLGFFVSFSGTVTYKNAESQREAARFVPLDRLLLETDCPYLAPLPLRGKSAEPGMVELTYALIAEIRGIPVEELVRAAADNAHELFGLPTRS